VHPQTLRLYERVGLLKPSRSQGNTRRIRIRSGAPGRDIDAARDMGVNLGHRDILNMREKISRWNGRWGICASGAAGIVAVAASYTREKTPGMQLCVLRRGWCGSGKVFSLSVISSQFQRKEFVCSFHSFPNADCLPSREHLVCCVRGERTGLKTGHYKIWKRRPAGSRRYLCAGNCTLCRGRDGSGGARGRHRQRGGGVRFGMEKRASLVMERARIPKRYEHCDFESYVTDLTDGKTWLPQHAHSLKQAKLFTQGFVREYPVRRKRTAVHGAFGRGKTHLPWRR